MSKLSFFDWLALLAVGSFLFLLIGSLFFENDKSVKENNYTISQIIEIQKEDLNLPYGYDELDGELEWIVDIYSRDNYIVYSSIIADSYVETMNLNDPLEMITLDATLKTLKVTDYCNLKHYKIILKSSFDIMFEYKTTDGKLLKSIKISKNNCDEDFNDRSSYDFITSEGLKELKSDELENKSVNFNMNKFLKIMSKGDQRTLIIISHEAVNRMNLNIKNDDKTLVVQCLVSSLMDEGTDFGVDSNSFNESLYINFEPCIKRNEINIEFKNIYETIQNELKYEMVK